jgi:hypothetical protein
VNRKLVRRLAILFLLPALAGPGAEPPPAGLDRREELIESLNAASAGRAAVVDAIHGELRGPDGGRMREALLAALFRSNFLIQRGAAESLARRGDPDDLPWLEALLATSANLEVKCLLLRLLPAFCLAGQERARIAYLRHATDPGSDSSRGLLAPLRRPPLDRRGRLAPRLEYLRRRVLLAILAQFDPVGAAIGRLEEPRFRDAALATVVHYVGGGLGNDPSFWARIWAASGAAMAVKVPDELEEIRLNALQSLQDMGAEGLPETIGALDGLLSGSGILSQAVFDALAGMCAAAFANYPPLAGPGLDLAGAGEVWRDRVLASSLNLAVFAAGKAAEALAPSGDPGLFAAAAACLGTVLAPPPGFPDPEGRLAGAAGIALARLESLLTLPDLPRENREAALRALGACGAPRAVAAILGLLDSPYASPGAGSRGLRLAEAAVDSLRDAASGPGAGREAARAALLALLSDNRGFPPVRPGQPPIRLAHLALWRLRRLAKSTDTGLDAESWRLRLGW